MRHLEQHFVAFARALADSGEHRDALVALDHRVNELHHQHSLADAGAAEHCPLAALRERREEVDHLDASGEELRHAALGRERRRLAVDGPTRRVGGQRLAPVADASEHVEQAPQHRLADCDGHWSSVGLRAIAPPEADRWLERDRPRRMRIDMGLDFRDDDPSFRVENLDRGFDRRRDAVEGKVEYGARIATTRPPNSPAAIGTTHLPATFLFGMPPQRGGSFINRAFVDIFAN